MSLESFLIERKGSILPLWRDSLFDVYPPGSHGFLKNKKERFANPVGYTLSTELERLFGEIAKEDLTSEARSSLESILKIRAVQDLKPSEAVRFILDLKGIVRNEVNSKGSSGISSEELREFELKMDKICLEAFDIYNRCKQKIYELRVNEVKRQVSRLMERANLICEIPDVIEDH
ncbi:MAG: hypothetical protein DRH12_00800 [Deltaproteobacteria bacterium]|nr:MAG: hypothetical protein DRH12_00800 [Deltaproteobacteria bacterium]